MNEKLAKRTIFDHDWYPLSMLRRSIDKALVKILRQSKDISVIDLGCGDAPYKDLFLKYGMQYKTADIAGEPDYLIDDNGRTSAESASFDVVCSFQVLEHVWDIDAYFSEVKRLLKSNGLCLLSTHGVWLYHPHPGDYRRWTKAGLLRELKSRGFEIEDAVPIVGPLGWLSVFRLIAYTHIVSRIPVLGRWICCLLSLVLNTRAKLEDWITPKQVYCDNACVYLVVVRKNI